MVSQARIRLRWLVLWASDMSSCSIVLLGKKLLFEKKFIVVVWAVFLFFIFWLCRSSCVLAKRVSSVHYDDFV